jgi:Ran GTPase-activating protein (RanGAP) involved in mRNA processing and transport
MKTTLFCMHVMPHEIEMLERFMVQYRKALSYLDANDNFTMKVSLNLNPELTDWEASV